MKSHQLLDILKDCPEGCEVYVLNSNGALCSPCPRIEQSKVWNAKEQRWTLFTQLNLLPQS